MAEALSRREPVPSVPARFAGVTVALAQPMKRWSLRGRDPEAIEALIGVQLPRRIGETLGPLACLGPDEWLWRSADASPNNLGEGKPVSMVDVSERSVCFVIEGPAASAVINAGCPLDLERFAIGRTTRTVYDGVEIIIQRQDEQRWSVEVWRSFAEWLWNSLTTAAACP